ncbi:hypothetical protein ACU6TU_09810 [Halomonas sp. LS-001]
MNHFVQTCIIDQPTPFSARVAWRYGCLTRGVLTIDFEYEDVKPRDVRPASELVAVHHVLYPAPCASFRNDPAQHQPLIFFSDPETLAVVRKTSSCAGAYTYANYLRTHQPASNASLASECPDLSPYPWDNAFQEQSGANTHALEEEDFLIRPRHRCPSFIVWPRNFGAVGITEHALKRLEQYQGNANHQVRKINRYLSREALVQIRLPKNVERTKLVKYQGNPDVECWRHDTGDMLFILARGHLCRTLLTVVQLPQHRLGEHRIIGNKKPAPCPGEKMLML